MIQFIYLGTLGYVQLQMQEIRIEFKYAHNSFSLYDLKC